MANSHCSTGLLQLAVLFILLAFYVQMNTTQTTATSDEPDRIIKKRGDDAWFLEKSAWPNMPYDFGYEVRDLEGNEQYRNEQSDGNRVTGSYGYFGPDGIYRHVDYVADELGFRAKIHTSEPGVSGPGSANVKIITEPLLPQPLPVPGGRILRPIEQPGIYDPTIIGDPVLEKGLSYIPSNGNTRGSSNSGGSSSNSANSNDVDDMPSIRPISSSIRGGVGTATGSRPSTNSGGISSSKASNSLSGRPSYGREIPIAAGRDATIVTRDPSVFANGIDDILGIGGRGISIPIDRSKSVIPIHNMGSSMGSNKAREDSGQNLAGSRTRGGGSSSGIDELRNRELLERERKLAEREQSLIERERNANRHRTSNANSGIKGGGENYHQVSIPASSFVKRRDSSSSSLSKQQQDAAMSDASTIDKEPADSEFTKKNGSSSSVNKEESTNSDSKESDSNSSNQNANAIETMLMNKNGKKSHVKVYISDGPMKGDNVMNTATVVGNERERETTNTNNVGGMKDEEETSTRKTFESGDQQISHLRFDDETDRIVKYRLKSNSHQTNSYRYPIDENSAIQLKRSYPKNYQQYRLLRSRLPREPRERSSIRSLVREPSSKEANRLVSKAELTSSSTKDSSRLLKTKVKDDNGQSTKESSLIRLRMGGDRILDSILSSKITSLKDNERQIVKTDQRINFRNDLLPKVNIAYNNLIRRTGSQTDQIIMSKSEKENTIQSNNEQQSINQLYIQRYSNQTKVKNNSTSNLKKHLNDAVLLTNADKQQTRNDSDYSIMNEANNNETSNDLQSILQNALLSTDASSISEESLLPSINNSIILNLIKNLKNESFDTKSILNNSTPTESTDANLDESSNDSVESIDSKIKNEESTNKNFKKDQNEVKILSKSSLISPLELQLIKLAPTIISKSRI